LISEIKDVGDKDNYNQWVYHNEYVNIGCLIGYTEDLSDPLQNIHAVLKNLIHLSILRA
jgi:hypothetical protein